MVALALIAIGLSATPASFGGAPGQIAFARIDSHGRAGIYAVFPDGNGLRRVVKNGVDPAWSRDGLRLAYSLYTPSRRGGIYVSDANGGHARRITGRTPAEANQPSWSPDGKRVVFAARGYIYTVQATGRGLKRMTSRPFMKNPQGKRLKIRVTDSRPTWSPDGSRIAFVRHGNGGKDNIWTMRADGRAQHALTNTGTRGWLSPDWSPDGSKLVYARSPGLWVIDADGKNDHVIFTSGSVLRGEPAWSPNGTEIAYSALTDSPQLARRIFVVGADGSSPHVVSSSGGDPHAVSDSAPAWQSLPAP
jgi:dipeptidyl aminopeptidase/acylaminoacyl peptidase